MNHYSLTCTSQNLSFVKGISHSKTLLSVLLIALFSAVPADAEKKAGAGFMSKNPDTKELKERLNAAEAGGKITFDYDIYNADGDPGAIRFHPGSMMRWDWPEKDISGSWRVKIYDDSKVPTQPKANSVGPYIGIMDSTGRTLAVGAVYGPELNGAQEYSVFAYNKGSKEPWKHVKHLEVPREKGWREWKFVMTKNRQLQIYAGNELLRSFEADEHGLKGIASLLMMGDPSRNGKQGLWFSGFAEMQERTPGQAGNPGKTGMGF